MDRVTKWLCIGTIVNVFLVGNRLLDELYLGWALHLGSTVMIGWVGQGVLIVAGMAYAIVQSVKHGKGF